MVTGIDPSSQIMTNPSPPSQNPPMATQLGNIANGSPTPPSVEPVKRPSDARRSNKPIMEKRRRARINNCLNELKTLILDAMKKDPARHSKLEKADILEMTVKHLQNLQRQSSHMADSNVLNKFKAGFTECANEVNRFPGIEPIVKRRLLQHLNNCINGNAKPQETPIAPHQQPSPNNSSSVQVHILPSPPSSPQREQPQITTTGNGYYLNGIQLIPTKLSNGSVAFVLPQAPAPVPMLVPIPQRTASTGSATSNTSLYDNNSSSASQHRLHRENSTSPYHTPPSPANSYDAMDCTPPSHVTAASLHHHHAATQQMHHHQQQYPGSYSPVPLSLVMRKDEDDDKPWRPW
ncbi:protein hairy-like [Culicoides brevitarsis]|uniref:protein hairy-like n=1 Tax=Culicoides brevitarsis TaxID=469753 RepID=UPI00307BFC33